MTQWDVRMMQEILSPGVEHVEKADPGAEVLGIGGDLQQRGGAGAEQQAVENPLVVECQWRQLMGQRENHMHVGNGQQFLAAGSEPLLPRVGLAFWAMTVAA